MTIDLAIYYVRIKNTNSVSASKGPAAFFQSRSKIFGDGWNVRDKNPSSFGKRIDQTRNAKYGFRIHTSACPFIPAWWWWWWFFWRPVNSYSTLLSACGKRHSISLETRLRPTTKRHFLFSTGHGQDTPLGTVSAVADILRTHCQQRLERPIFFDELALHGYLLYCQIMIWKQDCADGPAMQSSTQRAESAKMTNWKWPFLCTYGPKRVVFAGFVIGGPAKLVRPRPAKKAHFFHFTVSCQ